MCRLNQKLCQKNTLLQHNMIPYRHLSISWPGTVRRAQRANSNESAKINWIVFFRPSTTVIIKTNLLRLLSVSPSLSLSEQISNTVPSTMKLSAKQLAAWLILTLQKLSAEDPSHIAEFIPVLLTTQKLLSEPERLLFNVNKQCMDPEYHLRVQMEAH